MTRTFLKIPEDVRKLPKMLEVFQRQSYQENALATWGKHVSWLVNNISVILLRSKPLD